MWRFIRVDVAVQPVFKNMEKLNIQIDDKKLLFNKEFKITGLCSMEKVHSLEASILE